MTTLGTRGDDGGGPSSPSSTRSGDSSPSPVSPAPETSRRTAPSRRFRGDIDGLRAVAILLVVAYHADLPGFSGGFIGVDVFFVISGYLITRNLLVESDRSGRVAVLAFWGRRIRRLVPAMALMVVVTLVAAALIVPVISFGDVVKQGGAASLYVSNVFFARESGSYFGSDIQSSPFLHTWSLGVEEQFYAVWPLLVLFVVVAVRARRAWLRPALGLAFAGVLVVSFALSLRLTDQLDPWAFYGLQSRAWEFAAAGLVAVVVVPRWFAPAVVRGGAAIIGLGLIVVAGVTLTGATPYPGLWALLPVVGTVLVLLGGSPDDATPGAVTRALEAAPAQWIGRVSYSWYLWHWPFIVLMAAQLGDTVVVKLTAAGLSLVVATVGHRLVENPVRFSPRLTTSVGRTFALGAVLTVGSLLVGVVALQFADRYRSTDLDRMVAAAERDRGAEACSARPSSPSGIEYCLAGAVDGDRTVMVIGDSHAQHWSTTLDEVAGAEGIRVIGRWMASCPAVDVELKPSSAGRGVMEECARFRADTRTLVDELKPDGVVVANANLYEYRILGADGQEVARADRAPLWREAVADLLGGLRREGIGVGVIRDNPQLPFDPIECLAVTPDVAACSPSRADTVAPTEAIRAAEDAALADVGAVPELATFDDICDATTCHIASADHLRYLDAGHLTTAFTRTEAPGLRDLLRRTLAPAP